MACLLHWFDRQCAARPLAIAAAALLAGLILAAHMSLPVICLATAGSAVLAAFAALALLCKRRFWALLIAAFFLLGAARMQWALDTHPPVEQTFSVAYEGEVVSEPFINAAGDRVVCGFHLTSLGGEPRDCRVRLYLRSDLQPLEGIEYGQKLSCSGSVWPQRHRTNPYEFDSMNWLLSQGVTGMAAAKLEDVTVLAQKQDVQSLRIAVRHAISDRIDILFPRNPDLVRAFVLGDRSGLDEELRDSFQVTGITHLICISGLHITVLAVAISLLLRRLRLPPLASGAITLTALVIYGFLIGFPASLVRAIVMFAVLQGAPLAGRPFDPVTQVMTALAGMLLYNPFHLYQSGFVLSFSAVGSLILLARPLNELFRIPGLSDAAKHSTGVKKIALRAVAYLAGILLTTFAVQLGTLPAVIAYFGKQSAISLAVNPVAIPIVVFTYPIELAAVLLSFVWLPLGQLIAMLPDALLLLLVRGVSFISSFPLGRYRITQYPVWLVLVHCAICLAASPLSRIRTVLRRWLPLTLLGLACVSLLCAWVGSLGFQVLFLDAEQADAAVIKTEGRVYLYDLGSDYTPMDDYVQASCLKVDGVFLSHIHYDHAGGLAPLLEVLDPGVIYVPVGWWDDSPGETVQAGIAMAQERGIPIVELTKGDRIRLSDHAEAIVWSPDGPGHNGNDMSLLLEVQYDGASFLFTGDLTQNGEPLEVPDVDVLKVAHHGASNATSVGFLAGTTPELSVISVGAGNRYGHPNADTLERLEMSGTDVLRTDQAGAITVRVRKDGTLSVSTYLKLEDAS